MANSAIDDSGPLLESAVPVIRFVDPAQGGDLSIVPEAVRPYAFRSYQHQEVAVLVSDMSGFTRLTRKYGPIHFTSIIARTRQLCLPILHKFGAMLITAEGDSLNVVFPSAEGAVLAALDMQRIVKESNKALSSERAHFELTLDGVGIDFGQGPILDRAGKLHGHTFSNAHLLGEELCSKGCVAVSQRCFDQLKVADCFAHLSHKPMPLPDNADAHEAIKAMGAVFELAMEFTGPVCLPSCDDESSPMQEGLLQFCQRHSPVISDVELAALDAEIEKKYMQQKVVLMLDFEYVNNDTLSAELGLKFACLFKLQDILRVHNACKVEDVLYLFDDPVDAILAATKCRAKLESLRKDGDESESRATIKGFGVHSGQLLLIEGTDVHWGDPVNTASKLGQDFATNADIFISQKVYDSCGSDPRLQELMFEHIAVDMSGVKFTPYRVISKPDCSSLHIRHPNMTSFRVSSKSIHDIFLQSGVAMDIPVDSTMVGQIMRSIDSGYYTDEQIAEIIQVIQTGAPANTKVTFSSFIEWAFADA